MSKVSDSKALQVNFADHDVHGCLEVLGDQGIYDIDSMQCFLQVDDETALRDLLNLLPNWFIFNLVVFYCYFFNQFFKEIEIDSYFSFVHKWEHEKNGLLAKSVQTFVAGKRFLSFLECSAAHIDELQFLLFV